jgi:aspartate carbamoyltransferase catalytic subunit
MTAFTLQHVIESQQFDRNLLEVVFQTADQMKADLYGERRFAKSLEGRIMASLFYEPSTRTRFSFESAMLRLGGSVITTENAREFSSAAKGESLSDSTRIMNGYADVIVMRHNEAGSAAHAAEISCIPVINAGDGAGQHPTQALLDMYTIVDAFSGASRLKIAMVGDLRYGRQCAPCPTCSPNTKTWRSFLFRRRCAKWRGTSKPTWTETTSRGGKRPTWPVSPRRWTAFT